MSRSRNQLTSVAEVRRCQQRLKQLEKAFAELNQETELEQWSEEVGQCYRLVMNDIAVLDSFLDTLHVTERVGPPLP